MSEDKHSGTGSDSGVKDKGRKLSDAEWAEIIEKYELGESPLTDLAEEYGVTRQNLWKRFKAEGVKAGSRAHEKAEAVKKAALDASAARAAADQTFSDQRLAWIEETRVGGYKSLKQAEMLAKKIVADAMAAGKPLATVDDDLKAAQRFTKIVVDTLAAKLDVLNADSVIESDDLPIIQLDDLTDEEIRDFHKQTGAIEDEDDLEELLADAAKVDYEAKPE